MASSFKRLLILTGLLLVQGGDSAWAKAFHREVTYDYQVNSDLTHQELTTQNIVVLTDRAIAEYSQIAFTYDPKSEVLDILEAWVDQPDGRRLTVAGENIFTRPSAASRDAPGFVNSETRTIV
ncbi:DUF3857 domain-containing protein [Microvirga sp. GCM10011540]|uniref:DUF3857 domain-containing protein n=1 Tax=Microvirga sp. GCM10011540 TaxID=3317338 RepID=UPI003606ED38